MNLCIYKIFRWRPVLTAENVIISVISMLMDPNTDSPANVDASVN
jgi:ubiquitin-protein ligase